MFPPDLMAALERKKTKGLDQRKLEDVLTRSDLVKFAKYRADVEEAKDAKATAKAIVDATAQEQNGEAG